MKAALKFAVCIVFVFVSMCGADLSSAVVPEDTPEDTLCKADLDQAACQRFTKMLTEFGHDLTVFEGSAFGKVSQLREKTFIVVMNCSDNLGNVYLVVVRFIKDDLASISVKPTGGRRIGV